MRNRTGWMRRAETRAALPLKHEVKRLVAHDAKVGVLQWCGHVLKSEKECNRE